MSLFSFLGRLVGALATTLVLLLVVAALFVGYRVVTHGQEDALVHAASALGLDAAPLSLQGRGDEEAA